MAAELPLPIEEEPANPDRLGAGHVVFGRVSDHHRLRGLDTEELEHSPEDAGAGLDLAMDTRRDPRVDVQPVVADEGVEIAAGVGDEAQLEVRLPERLEGRENVLVELEVLRLEPTVRDGDGHLPAALALAAHPADDVLGETDPHLLVVVELRMMLEVEEGGGPRLGVA